MLDLSQEGLSQVIGGTRVQIARWEIARDKAIPGPADRALRFLYAGTVGGDGLVKQLIELLTEIDDLQNGPEVFSEDDQVWQRKAA